MSDFLIEHTPSAYRYPLLIKHLLHAPMTQSADQEIVYRDLRRYTYRDLRERIGRLASGLTAKGVRRGDVVGVLDWDSNRYLESYFAVPMLGATLQTVNIRLSPEQVLFTLNHARPRLLLVNVEFLPLIEQLQGQLESVEGIVLMSDDGVFPDTPVKTSVITKRSWQTVRPILRSRISTRIPGRRCSTPREPLACPRASISAIASLCCTR